MNRRSFFTTLCAVLIAPFIPMDKIWRYHSYSDLSTLSPDEFWKILCDKNHPQHTEATEYFAKVLSEPLYPSRTRKEIMFNAET